MTAAELKELIHYDPKTGQFTWRVRAGNRVHIGDTAGSLDCLGYRVVRVGGLRYKAHRLAWLYTHDAWPVDQIDHINGARDDNRIENLRECSPAENQQNRMKGANNTSGFVGVYWNQPRGKWLAQIGLGGRKRSLGYFASAEDAYAAYLQAKKAMHAFQPAPRYEVAA